MADLTIFQTDVTDNPIKLNYPKKTYAQSLAEAMGQYNSTDYTPLATQYAEPINKLISEPIKYTPLEAPVAQGLDASYWSQLFNQQASQLGEKYFTGPNAVKEMVQEDITSRGLLGSGVEQGILQESVYEPYGKELGDLSTQMALSQAEYDAQLEQFNIQNKMTMDQLNAQLGLSVQQINKEFGLSGLQTLAGFQQFDQQFIQKENQFMQQLGSQVALAEQGMLSEMALAELEAQIKEKSLAYSVLMSQDELRLTALEKMGERELDPEMLSRWMSEYEGMGGYAPTNPTSELLVNPESGLAKPDAPENRAAYSKAFEAWFAGAGQGMSLKDYLRSQGFDA